MDGATDRRRRLRPPSLFRNADAVFAGNHSAPREDLPEKFIERSLHPLANGRIVMVARRHNVDVYVSVSGMSKTGHRITIFFSQFPGEPRQVDQPSRAARRCLR
jgi:hypothetical protein